MPRMVNGLRDDGDAGKIGHLNGGGEVIVAGPRVEHTRSLLDHGAGGTNNLKGNTSTFVDQYSIFITC